RCDGERILVVANLSRFVEYVELDLTPYRGRTPVELFSRRGFPAITDRPYMLSLGPHAFFWFDLEEEHAATVAAVAAAQEPPKLHVDGPWEAILEEPDSGDFEAVLPEILVTRRWFGGKAQPITSVSLEDTIPLET